MSHKAMSIPPIAAMICGRWLRGSGAGMPSQPPDHRARGCQCKQLHPDLRVAKRVHALDHLGEQLHQVADDILRATGYLAEADDALVGADFDKHELSAIDELVRGPSCLRQRDRQRMRDDFGDLHVSAW